MSVRYYEKPDILDRIPTDAHAVIEASAGTGKTYTIEHLFIELLLTKDVQVENILVLTFTEKAAGELRARIRGIIERILSSQTLEKGAAVHSWRIDERAGVKLDKALFSFDKAPIHTIHGFFQRVIIENAFNSCRLFEQTLVDSREQFASAFKTVLRKVFANDPVMKTYLSCWLRAMGDIDKLETFLYACHSKKRALKPDLKPEEIGDALVNLSALAAGDADFEALKSGMKKEKIHASTIKAVINRIRSCADSAEAFQKDKNLPEFLCSLDWSNFTYVKDRVGHLRSALPVVDAFLVVGDKAVSFPAAIAQIFLPAVIEILNEEKRVKGLYDFDDMISLLLEALKGPQGMALAATLRSRYRYVLIDESQDTDEVQWEIFRQVLCENTGNSLYLIGDPKQAIYGFRGADVVTYLKARDVLCGGEKPIGINNNYRSTPGLVNAYNEVFRQKDETPFFTGKEITYDLPVACGQADLRATDPTGKDIVPVVVLEVEAEGDHINYDPLKNALGRSIALEIKKLLSAEGCILFGKGADLKPVTASDIFILTRNAKEGVEISRYLGRQGIPFAFYKQDGLFQTIEAEEIRDLLRAVDAPSDMSCRFKAWLTPFFSIPLEQLSHCRDIPDSEPLVKRLFEWNGLAKKRDFQLLFGRIIDESGLVRREIFNRETERGLTNYLHIFEILLEEASHTLCSLTELVMKLDDFITEAAAPVRDNGNIQRLETEKEAVQIMTMHKSKGLEASVVFLFGGYTAFPEKEFAYYHDDGKQRVAYIRKGGVTPPDVSEIAEREKILEDQRLIYVALTRAKARLYLPFVDPDRINERMKAGPYAQLNERLAAMMPGIKGGGLAHLFVVELLKQWGSMTDAEERTDFLKAGRWRPGEELLGPVDKSAEFEALKKSRAGFGLTSYSRIKALKGGYISPLVLDEELPQTEEYALSHLKEENIPGGTEYGAAIHEILEKVQFRTFIESPAFDEWQQREDVSGLFSDSLLKRGFDLPQVSYSKKMLHAALTTPVPLAAGKTLPGLYTLNKKVHEVEFIYPYPEAFHRRLCDENRGEIIIERGFVKGFIDFLFEHDGLVYFADWKTDILGDYSEAAIDSHFTQNYAMQAKLYLIAVVKMLDIHDSESYEKRVGGFLYCFMRGMLYDGTNTQGVLFKKPSWSEVLGFEKEMIDNEYI